MKKVLLLAVAGVFVLGLSSCKKEWTCACTVSGIALPAAPYTAKLTKSDAKKTCDQQEATYKMVSAANSCTLK